MDFAKFISILFYYDLVFVNDGPVME
jgi:hypothetical protein